MPWSVAEAKTAREAIDLAVMRAPDLVVLDLDREDARTAGEIRAALARQGTPIGPYDVLIAGQARSRNLVLVTRNLREFERAPGLTMENGQAP